MASTQKEHAQDREQKQTQAEPERLEAALEKDLKETFPPSDAAAVT